MTVGTRSQLRVLVEELRRHSPEWAERLAQATSEWEVKEIACRLFNLSQHLMGQVGEAEQASEALRDRIHRFMTQNLHKGPTLKLLAEFLGYAEKYCSEIFQAEMGESFSHCLRRLRLEKARQLLVESDASVAEIAETIGFSDQFAFSHFFKKAMGRSPRQFRERIVPLPPGACPPSDGDRHGSTARRLD